jgi:hypothetical protein
MHAAIQLLFVVLQARGCMPTYGASAWGMDMGTGRIVVPKSSPARVATFSTSVGSCTPYQPVSDTLIVRGLEF